MTGRGTGFCGLVLLLAGLEGAFSPVHAVSQDDRLTLTWHLRERVGKVLGPEVRVQAELKGPETPQNLLQFNFWELATGGAEGAPFMSPAALEARFAQEVRAVLANLETRVRQSGYRRLPDLYSLWAKGSYAKKWLLLGRKEEEALKQNPDGLRALIAEHETRRDDWRAAYEEFPAELKALYADTTEALDGAVIQLQALLQDSGATSPLCMAEIARLAEAKGRRMNPAQPGQSCEILRLYITLDPKPQDMPNFPPQDPRYLPSMTVARFGTGGPWFVLDVIDGTGTSHY